MINSTKNLKKETNILVLGGNGKTGRRVVERLKARNLPVRIGSRSGVLPFDWENPATWEAVLQGMEKVYVTFQPDLAVPGAVEAIRQFTDLAVKSGVQQLVLLSGRGEDEAQACERIVQQSGVDWTILRASWFCQNFSEGMLHDLILSGTVPLPIGEVKEPFIDVDDIADVAVAALTEGGHAGKLYELTGPRLMTFAEAVGEIAKAAERHIHYMQISQEDFATGLKQQGLPEGMTALLNYLFTTVLDGRNALLTDGVQQALNRVPRDFSQYVQDTAKTGVWQG